MKSYTPRPAGVFSGFYSCAFTTKSGTWQKQAVFDPNRKFGEPAKYETEEETLARLQIVVDEILTKSETIPVIFTTTAREKEMELLCAEYPEVLTIASETVTQHSGEKYRVTLWVAQLHERPKNEV